MGIIKRRNIRALERFRKKVKTAGLSVTEGNGKSSVRESKAQILKKALVLKKKSGKLTHEFENVSSADLQAKLVESRQELFNLRFKHAASQLENVAIISATKRRIARILTLIKQKEVGA